MDSLLSQYKKQWSWRNWEDLFSRLPDLNGSLVYDLGCAHGDHSLRLSELGAEVVGLDGDEELLEFAKERGISNSQFKVCDLSQLETLNLPLADGIWTSFTAAYFTHFDKILAHWKKFLGPNGWIAITEMTGLFNHYPMTEKYEGLLARFYKDSFERKNYDFESGKKLKDCLERNGFEIQDSCFLEDRELSFQGPATREVVTAWENRFRRLKGLKNSLGDDFEPFRNEFISAIQKKEHVSDCKVYFYLAQAK